MQLEIERQALKKEEDEISKNRLLALEKEISDNKEIYDRMKAQWELEKENIKKEKELKEEIEEVKRQIEESERLYDLDKLAVLKHGKLPKLQRQLEEAKKRKESKEGILLKEEVGEEEIAEIISRWTGIPVTKLVENERDKLLNLDNILHQRVVGQDEAVEAVTDSVIRARS
jgi:ATP-dependent Clp protease ATP-binding subunit ClpB